jgi:hypothetical protein
MGRGFEMLGKAEHSAFTTGVSVCDDREITFFVATGEFVSHASERYGLSLAAGAR